jgi:anhydro-N-acetylmuramic acid kinase
MMSKNLCLKDIIGRKEKFIIGLNSGTSANGIDACLAKISGSGYSSKVEFVAGATYPISREFQTLILKCAEPSFNDASAWLALDIILAEHFAKAAGRIIKKAGLNPEQISLIGSHGQTIRHMPQTKYGTITYQLADPARIAVRTGIITVGDFRVADTAAGGQGAPLTPIVNAILFGKKDRSIGVLNIGGIANITSIKSNRKGHEIFGCDTGPGNMIIDWLTKKLFQAPFDKGGKLASQGKACRAIIDNIIKQKYFAIKGVKSTGREQYGDEFCASFLKSCKKRNLSKYDIMATATQLTAIALSKCCTINGLKFDELLLTGGGAKNLFLKRAIKDELPNSQIDLVNARGYHSDYLEAISFAILANEAICSNRYDLTTITGSAKAVVLGKICQP